MISTKELIWRIYLKYGTTGPTLKSSNKNRQKLYVKKDQKEKRKQTERFLILKNILTHEYIDKEFGIKLLSKKYKISYTQMRGLLQFLNIDLRTGRSVVTNNVRKMRKEKALLEYDKKIGWFDSNIRRKIEKYNARGVQGYYFNQSLQKYVWLRSSYEYIFAKWLDKTNHIWDVECSVYDIEGRNYKPDFFIYDTDSNLIKIVEIKGYWDNNSYKANILNEELDIPVIVIKDIEKYISENSSKNDELAEWKQKRIIKIG